MDKADIFFGRTLKLTLGWKIRSHRSENGKKIMGEDPQSLENHGFPQISQLVLHSNKTLKSQDFSVFLLFSSLFCPICFSDWSLTQTLTRVGTNSGSFSSPPAARLAPSAAPPFQMRPAALGSHLVLSSSQHPCHGLGRLSLGGPGHMGVGIQSEPGGEVAQHAGGRLFQNPAQAQRSGLRRERRSHGMSEPCPDGTGRGIWSWRRRGGARCPGRMGPPFGDGNTHGLLPAFSFCSNRTLTVSSASGRVR